MYTYAIVYMRDFKRVGTNCELRSQREEAKGKRTFLYARALLAPGASSFVRGRSAARWLRTSDPSLLGLQPRVRSANAHAPQPLAG